MIESTLSQGSSRLLSHLFREGEIPRFLQSPLVAASAFYTSSRELAPLQEMVQSYFLLQIQV